MKIIKFARNPHIRLLLNFAYAVGNCALGFFADSWWFITVGAYYAVLATTRFAVLRLNAKANGDHNTELFARRITGILLVVLSFCIVGENILAALQDRGSVHHEIVMIAIATYTFTKIAVAIVGMVKAKRYTSPAEKTLRNISFADACVSVYSMQRSMLVSFPGMNAEKILFFNIFTGTAAWMIVMILGLNLIGGKYTDMAKSKLVEINEKIAGAVTGGYKEIEKGVVEGYKKIEKGVVSGYTKIEDKFINAYLTKDGETVEEAKARLKKANK